MKNEGIIRNFKTMRATGYTTNLVEMCRDKKCHIIFANNEQLSYFKNGKDLEGLSAISLTQFEKLRSIKEPFYLDNGALEVILQRWEDSERSHDLLIEEHEELKRRNNLLFDEFIDLRRQIIEEQRENLDLANKISEIEFHANRSFLRKVTDWIKNLFT